MAVNGEPSAFTSLFHGIGYALEELDQRVFGKGSAAASPDRAGEAPGVGEALPPEPAPEAEPADPFEHMEELGAALGVAAGGWLVARLLRPRPVSWPRVILAGLTATALYDLVHYMERRLLVEPEPGKGAALEPREAPADTLLRYAAGLGTAVAYASILYPRLPGSPLTRGLIFGAVDAATLETGGALGLLRQVAPQVAFPLERLAGPLSAHGSPLAHLAFGFGLGVVYRDGSRKERRRRADDD